MGMPVGELLARMSSRELTEWMAFHELEPFGSEQDDLRTGVVASTMANLFRPKGSKALQPADMIQRRSGEDTSQSDLQSAIMNIFKRG